MVADGTPTYYVWDGLRLLETRGQSGGFEARFTHGLAPIEGIGSCIWADAKRLLYDHRGSAWKLTDLSGTVVATRDYSAFGEIVSETGTWPDKVPFGYQSNWMTLIDMPDGSPLYLSPTRIYHAGTGRFLQRDLLGTAFGPNLYEYVSSTPLASTDAAGLGPNQSRAVGFTTYVKRVRQWEKANPQDDPCEILECYQKHSRETAAGIGSTYTYLDDVGWVDFGHFSKAAQWAYGLTASSAESGGLPALVNDFISGNIVDTGGEFIEYGQALHNAFPMRDPDAPAWYDFLLADPDPASSAYSEEDIPSNRLGAAFGAYWARKCKRYAEGSKTPLADALADFLGQYGPRERPWSVPGYSRLPRTQAQLESDYYRSGWVARNVSTRYRGAMARARASVPGLRAAEQAARNAVGRAALRSVMNRLRGLGR